MSQNNTVTERDLFSWIEESLENEKLKQYEINLVGKSEKGDGYIGEIVFVSVNGITSDDKRKILCLVIKHGKNNEKMRQTLPVRAAFTTEIHIYNKVFPIFRQIQFEKKVVNVFKSVPKCYKTLILKDMEVIVFDNLNTRGYELYDRRRHFNLPHIKVILEEYGKLHALSFALKDQRIEEFNTISAFEADVFKGFMESKLIKRSLAKCVTNTLNMLQEKGELYLMEKLKHLIKKNGADMIYDLIAENEPQSVITHGDCWTNNFMFKYQNIADKTVPMNVAILDWQMSAVRSPAFDLSYLIYATSSKVELDQFEELLNVYYTSFSCCLTELGSNSQELFSFSSLKAHWRKYSLFGLIMATMILPMGLCDNEQAPALEDLDGTFGDVLTLDKERKELYYQRIKAVIRHYLEYTSI